MVKARGPGCDKFDRRESLEFVLADVCLYKDAEHRCVRIRSVRVCCDGSIMENNVFVWELRAHIIRFPRFAPKIMNHTAIVGYNAGE